MHFRVEWPKSPGEKNQILPIETIEGVKIVETQYIWALKLSSGPVERVGN